LWLNQQRIRAHAAAGSVMGGAVPGRRMALFGSDSEGNRLVWDLSWRYRPARLKPRAARRTPCVQLVSGAGRGVARPYAASPRTSSQPCTPDRSRLTGALTAKLGASQRR
jgi:hypothetical protein